MKYERKRTTCTTVVPPQVVRAFVRFHGAFRGAVPPYHHFSEKIGRIGKNIIIIYKKIIIIYRSDFSKLVVWWYRSEFHKVKWAKKAYHHRWYGSGTECYGQKI